MMFVEQWECLKCTWMNGFVRNKCRNCGEGRYHSDPEVNAAIVAEVRENQKWDAAHGIPPERDPDAC